MAKGKQNVEGSQKLFMEEDYCTETEYTFSATCRQFTALECQAEEDEMFPKGNGEPWRAP